MNQRQNEYMERYFKMLDEDSQHMEEMAVVFSHKCNICEEVGHIDYMCPLYPSIAEDTSQDNDYVIVKGVHLPIPVKSFNDYISLLDLLKGDLLISQEWDSFREKFIKSINGSIMSILKKNYQDPYHPEYMGKKSI